VGDHVGIPGVVLFLLFAFTFVPRLVLRWGTMIESLVLFFFAFLHSRSFVPSIMALFEH
jgi:hypothetical protein